MYRRLYALAILIGTIGFFILFYLYFFVYYTAVVVIHSNIPEYTIDFFATATAQKRTEFCPEAICELSDVSPFDYTITLSKENYETEVIPVKIKARKKQEFFVEFEKKARLELLTGSLLQTETSQEKIQRLREENLYLASFSLSPEEKITFSKKEDRVIFEYRTLSEIQKIADFPILDAKDIFAEYIGESKKIFVRTGKTAHIFDRNIGKLYTLPYEIPVSYIKIGNTPSQFLVVTEKGTFFYDTGDKTSQFQYLFRDFIFIENALIGVIYQDETQKKTNFNLTEKGNLVVLYTQDSKRRKVLLATDLKIDRIELQGEKVIVSAGETHYELQNF